jgi:hypothetical protein
MESISASRGAASSSSSVSNSFAALLGESLWALARDCPAAYHQTIRRLQGATVLVDVGDERVVVHGTTAGHELRPPSPEDPPPTVSLTATPAVLLGLLDGELTVLQCLLDERLHLVGSVHELLGLHEALDWYLRGAVRTTAFPELLRRFRSWARGQERFR